MTRPGFIPVALASPLVNQLCTFQKDDGQIFNGRRTCDRADWHKGDGTNGVVVAWKARDPDTLPRYEYDPATGRLETFTRSPFEFDSLTDALSVLEKTKP